MASGEELRHEQGKIDVRYSQVGRIRSKRPWNFGRTCSPGSRPSREQQYFGIDEEGEEFHRHGNFSGYIRSRVISKFALEVTRGQVRFV